MENLGFKINKIINGKYQMTISKEYATGSKKELIKMIDEDLQKLLSEFEKMKREEIER